LENALSQITIPDVAFEVSWKPFFLVKDLPKGASNGFNKREFYINKFGKIL